MTYSSAVAYLYRLQKHGIKLGLVTMTALMVRLGMPQTRYRTLHIAGTNGKGSTAAMAAAVLQAAGYRVGLYTSPHLVEFRERILVNGEMIAESRVAQLTEQLQALCQPDLSPTFFEYTTAMAFQHFADSGVDVAVLEVGLGGRFDATNVVAPLACAVTTISLDHQEYLGTTRSSIAFEKAGILKPGVPVVLGRIEDDAWRTIEQAARERQAPVFRLNEDFRTEGEEPQQFSYRGLGMQYDGLTCALKGRHQLDNAACALALLGAAAPRGIAVTAEAVRAGLRAVNWPGRLEVIDRRPTILLDGAHNPAAATALADSLTRSDRSHPSRPVVLVLGMMRDKDHRGFVEPLRDLVDEVVLTQADLPRSATAQELRASLEGLLPHPHLVPSISEAMALARQLATPDGLVCVTGSLMLVGECKAWFHGCGLSPLRG
ncbi:MAG TPA: folylpolyglutamate synthase/dihydrofolate synthase family protein [Nitrospiraceae bacterium]|jgi:dihydrofolate synthase/folylpolyglutamate synthase|nr:folylpolyglutamate synthase/dihydrofolate synthase family protein [Nitrospiraceae bacterium]